MINDDTIDAEQLPMAIGFTRLTRDVGVRSVAVHVASPCTHPPKGNTLS